MEVVDEEFDNMPFGKEKIKYAITKLLKGAEEQVADYYRILENVQKPAKPWPATLRRAPWRIQPDVHPESAKINVILQASLDFQRSTISSPKQE